MKIKERLLKLNKLLEIDQKRARIKEIEEEMSTSQFWNSNEMEQKTKELKDLKNEVDKFSDVEELVEIAQDEEPEELINEIEGLEKLARFSGKYDKNSAILNFYAGAGGDDAQDWTEMLLKMYLKWAGKNNYQTKILNKSAGGIAGIKNATIEIYGIYAYGKLKGENGVHRLVRQSPFNAKNLRQTSFSLVEVLPEIKKEELTIEEKDLKIDTFRSSGHGGQSVNTTDSAVRLTHIPTGLTATCQNERSQMQNKDSAMKVLRARLVKMLEDEHKLKIEELRGKQAEPEWGSQIRSYILHPYKMVKDHRTGCESKEPEKVLEGEIDRFLGAG